MENTNNNSNTHAKKSWYDRSYKILAIISLLLILASLVYLVIFYVHNGDVIYKDISITGGTTITVFMEKDIREIEAALKPQFPDVSVRAISDIRTGKQAAFFVESTASPDVLKPAIEKILGIKLTTDNSSIEFTGATLSSSFYQQLRLAVIISFVLMAVVVFIIFRTPIRSLSVIIAGLGDIMMTIVVMDIFHIPISTAGIVALLMLIGYSVDADILLTTRVIRNKESTINQRIFGAFKTGITMTLTAIVAVAVALAFTYSFSAVLSQMFTIILVGLFFDIFNCWVTNASLLKWYSEVSHKI